MNHSDAGHLRRLAEEWRQAQGLSHQQFATLLGRHKSEWSLIWRGLRTPSAAFISTLLVIAPEPWRSGFEKAHLADLRALYAQAARPAPAQLVAARPAPASQPANQLTS